MKTVAPITYFCAPYPGRIAVIPAGTTVTLAKNLPSKDGVKLYWSKGWRGMDEKAKSWKRNYGFLLTEHEVKNNRKVVIL